MNRLAHSIKALKDWVNCERFSSANRMAISVFIVFYFSISLIWVWANHLITLKSENVESRSIINTLSPITNLLGWGQNWGLFCPNVRDDNQYTLTLITFQNGLLKIFELPRLEKLGLLEKTESEKLRKIFNDNFPSPNFSYMRPSFSRRLSRKIYNKFNPPTRLSYFLMSEAIKAPADFTGKTSDKNDKPRTAVINYSVYGVSPDDYR